MRVGTGYDVHPLVQGRPLVLGGVRIPYGRGLQGHSDADALIHAIIDALLGAAALGDIGSHFPDSDPGYRGIASTLLLERVRDMIYGHGFAVVNVDATIVAEEPTLAPYIGEMCRRIAEALGIGEGRVSVKAKTSAKMGFLGQGEGIAAEAVALIERRTDEGL